MKKFLLITVCSLFFLHASALQMKDLWMSIPDSIMPHINQTIREELLHIAENNTLSETNNLLGEKMRVDTLTSNYMAVNMSQSLFLQMRLLPTTDGDSILCVVRTYGTMVKESMVSLYKTDWTKISDLKFDINEFVQKPDTMQTDKYDELILKLDPYIFSASLSSNDDTLTVIPSAANVTTDDIKSLKDIFLQRKYKWNGQAFN
ncbi:MAG: DUF3256 family protein [Prevotella sp.]